MANQGSVAVVNGPKGQAEIFEVWVPGQPMEFEVRYEGQTEKFMSLGEAYIEAGNKTGAQT